MKIALIHGTARHGNRSAMVVDLVLARLAEHADVQATRVEIVEHVNDIRTLPPWGTGGAESVATAWQEIAKTSDGFIFVLPEYNRGYPGEWKLLMDRLYVEYAGKVAGLIGVSDGMFGGSRVVDHVKPVLTEFGFIILNKALHFSNVDKLFDESGSLLDPAQEKRLNDYLRRFIEVSTMYQKVRYTENT